MNSYALYIARRLYAQHGTEGRASRLARLIATVGVMLGLTVMMVSVSVVVGFKGEITSKVRGFGGDAQVVNLRSLGSNVAEPLRLSTRQLAAIRRALGVQLAAPFCERPAMLKTDEAFRGVVLRGIADDYDTTFLARHLACGRLRTHGSEVVLSRTLAADLGLEVGSRIYAYAFEGGVRARRLTVVGIYETHMTDFDRTIVYAPIGLTQGLAAWDADQYTGLMVTMVDGGRSTVNGLRKTIHGLRDQDGAYLAAPTTEELFPGLFAWLSLLDANVWVILALMTAVAAFTMISGLLILILERTSFIGTMKALGADNRGLRHTFLLMALFIVGRALVLGDVLALILIVAQRQLGLIHLDATTYYVDTVPMALPWGLFALVNIVTLTLTTAAMIIPSYVVSHISPARAIRFE